MKPTESDGNLLGRVARVDDEGRVVEAFIRDEFLQVELCHALHARCESLHSNKLRATI